MLTAAHAADCILRSRLPQTILLTGESGSGKLTLAKKLAAALLCTGNGVKPCGVCNACHKVREGIHPDMTVVDEGEKEIKVEQARALRSAVMVLPNDGARRVTILRHAQNMNPAAQNALLKTLEEPPQYAFFILTAEKPEDLLQTIRSRCTRYDIAPAQAIEADAEQTADLERLLRALAAGKEAALLSACMRLEKKNRPAQKAFLQLFQVALRDAAFAALGLSGSLLPQLREQTTALAKTVSSERLLGITDFLDTLLQRIEVNTSAAALAGALCAGCYQICYL